MPDHEALLFANEAFYRAFADRDMEAMDEIWADDDSVACIHPGWGPLFGRDEVMQSWAAIIANPNSPDIACLSATAHIFGSAGFVVCYEEIAGQYLVATNIFVRDGSIWKLVHHQAGPTATLPPAEEPDETDDPGFVH